MTLEGFLNEFQEQGIVKSLNKKISSRKGKPKILTPRPTKTKRKEKLVQVEEQRPFVEIPSLSKRKTCSSTKKRIPSSREHHVQSTSLIQLDDSLPTSLS